MIYVIILMAIILLAINHLYKPTIETTLTDEEEKVETEIDEQNNQEK